VSNVLRTRRQEPIEGDHDLQREQAERVASEITAFPERVRG